MKNVLLALICVGAFFVSTELFGQCNEEDCDSLIQVASEGSFGPLNEDSTINEARLVYQDSMTALFQFDYETDSSHVQWTFGEFMLEGKKLVLSNWCNNQRVNFDPIGDTVISNWTQTQLNNRSLTKTFPVSTGDTIGFYRTQWISRRAYPGASFDYYKNPDVLSYSVELVDSTSGTRIALLDTGYYDVTTSNRRPCIVAWYPMYSRVCYLLPVGHSNTLVFIRVNTFSSGGTAKSWVRSDKYRPFGSTMHLASSAISAYCVAVEANITCSSNPSCDMSVTASSSPVGVLISISFPTALSSVQVFDIYGNFIWSGLIPLGSNPHLVGLSSGLYIVTANISGQIVCTHKIFVP